MTDYGTAFNRLLENSTRLSIVTCVCQRLVFPGDAWFLLPAKSRTRAQPLDESVQRMIMNLATSHNLTALNFSALLYRSTGGATENNSTHVASLVVVVFLGRGLRHVLF